MGFPGGARGEESACSAGDIMRHEFNPWVGKIPWSRAWQSTPLFLLENPMDREDWQVTAHRVAKSQTRLLTARAHTRVLNIGGHIVTGVESVVSNPLWPHGLQHARLPCPSTIQRAFSNSCPSSQICHPTILSSVLPFSSCLQSFPVSGSFPI